MGRHLIINAMVSALLGVVGCNRGESDEERAPVPTVSEVPDPLIETKVLRTIERFEEAQQQAENAHRQRMADGGRATLVPDLAPLTMKAAAQRRFAQLWWSARYPRGQTATAHVEIRAGVICCRVEMSGEPSAGAESDWTSYETRIDHLPAGRYRIIAPLGEVTLEVPETFVP